MAIWGYMGVQFTGLPIWTRWLQKEFDSRISTRRAASARLVDRLMQLADKARSELGDLDRPGQAQKGRGNRRESSMLRQRVEEMTALHARIDCV
jgi:hypothetical protein